MASDAPPMDTVPEALAEPPCTVDDVHDHVDRMMLSVFEAMRSASNPEEDPASQADRIIELYRAACASVDRLVGVDRSEAQQLCELEQLSAQYEASRAKVLQTEDELRELQVEVDLKLKEVLSDQLLGLSAPR